MKLAVISDDGEVFDAIDDIEEFDLDKTPARTVIVEDIKMAVQSALAAQKRRKH